MGVALLRWPPPYGSPRTRPLISAPQWEPGVKTARTLVNGYDSIADMVVASTWTREGSGPLQRSPSVRASIREAARYLEAMERVARIRTDVEVRAWQPEPDDARADELAERYRLTGPLRRFRAAREAVRSERSGR